jgi:uncharacterized protein (DUF58 family)
MDARDIIKKIRKIEIKTKGLSKNIFSGEYHSAFKGIGMTFSEVRAYRYGDEAKNIDWNVTARTDHPHIKLFEEDRELNVMLLVDISKSTFFGSRNKLKNDLATEISALISFSAISNNDKVGAILFTDRIEKYIPPKKGKKHILRIIREIIYFNPTGIKTDIGASLKYLNNVLIKRSIVFIISDFVSPEFNLSLQIARKKHDVIAVRVFDNMEINIPNVNILKVKDPETGSEVLLDTSSAAFRKKHNESFNDRLKDLKVLFNSYKIDLVEIEVNEDYTKKLHNFFKKRAN